MSHQEDVTAVPQLGFQAPAHATKIGVIKDCRAAGASRFFSSEGASGKTNLGSVTSHHFKIQTPSESITLSKYIKTTEVEISWIWKATPWYAYHPGIPHHLFRFRYSWSRWSRRINGLSTCCHGLPSFGHLFARELSSRVTPYYTMLYHSNPSYPRSPIIPNP